MGDQKTLLLAIVASLAILLSFQFLFPSEEKKISKQNPIKTNVKEIFELNKEKLA